MVLDLPRVPYFEEVMTDRSRDLRAVLGILRDVHARYALIGGLAVGYYGRPRATIDVDMLVAGRSIARIRTVAAARGYSVETHPDMIRLYASPDDEEAIADIVSIDSNPVLRAAYDDTESADVLGQHVQIVSRGALMALKFHAAVSPTRQLEDRYQDVADMGRVLRREFDPEDEETAHRIASLSYPGAGEDFERMIDDLRQGRPVTL